PNSAWNPSATLTPPWRTTAPTRGFGATRPQPRHARSRARRIAARSAGVSEVDAKTRSPEDMSRLGIEIRERGGEALVRTRLIAQLGDELDEAHGPTCIGEQDLERVREVECHRVGGESVGVMNRGG